MEIEGLEPATDLIKMLKCKMLWSQEYSRLSSNDDEYKLPEALNYSLVAANHTSVFDQTLFCDYDQSVAHFANYWTPPTPTSPDYSGCSEDILSSDISDYDMDRMTDDILALEDLYPPCDVGVLTPPAITAVNNFPACAWSSIPTTVSELNNDNESDACQTDVVKTSPPSPPQSPVHETPPNESGGGVRRRRQRQRQLWQFLLEILSDDQYSPSIIEWIHRDEGVFRFVKPRSVAELWGKRRHRKNMSYEHLSRAMRYYYRRGVMKRVVDLGRLVYQFLSNAEGWHEYTRRARRG